MELQIDYRNAKYQGTLEDDCSYSGGSNSKQRNGYGILIDDDLSLYASEWKSNKLNSSTVIYISHAKYIYGQWCNNEPHGLNVFRMGDTVLIGQFQKGQLIGKIIIVFQKFNYIAILKEESSNIEDQHISVEEGILGDWTVVAGGILKNYDELLRYIDEAGLPMKPHYFSLVKFFNSISNSKIQTIPCRGSENCYFGFQQGLGIVFNPNNGVVSIGSHLHNKLVEFGGIYEMPHFVIQGNFETGETIKYTKQRPKSHIYSIFHKMHKKSLNFRNQYFDSKVKIFTNVEELVRSKIDQIVNRTKKENTFTALDLNDSLDYHPEDMDEINRMYKIREEVYQSNHLPMKKTVSKYVQEQSPALKKCKSLISSKISGHSKKSTTKVNPSNANSNNLITNAPASPIIMKSRNAKSPNKLQSKQSNATTTRVYDKAEPVYEPIESSLPNSGNQVSEFALNKYKKLKYLPEQSLADVQYCQKADLTANVSSKEYSRSKDRLELPTFSHPYDIKDESSANRSPIRGPKYEDLSERRKRILNQFKELNTNIDNIQTHISKLDDRKVNRQNKEPTIPLSRTPRKQKVITEQASINSNVNKTTQENKRRFKHRIEEEVNYNQIQSPYTREVKNIRGHAYERESKEQKKKDNYSYKNECYKNESYKNEMLPLSIDTKHNIVGNKYSNKQYEFGNEQQSPAHVLKTILNTSDHPQGHSKQHQYSMRKKTRKQINQDYPMITKKYSENYHNDQNTNVSPRVKPQNNLQQMHTPSKKKTYKYYFD